MRNERRTHTCRTILTVDLALVLVTLWSTTLAVTQSGSPYDLTWYTIDGGGGTFSTGGGYTLGSTIGQPDAGVLVGGGYILVGGFWASGIAENRIYLPLVMRQAS